MYRQKGNLSKSPNQFRYRENILISRLYERFLRIGQHLGNLAVRKTFKLLKHKHIIYHFESPDLEIPNI